MIELPTKRKEIENYNPKLMILFGKPKNGKSTITAAIDSNLIIDLEDGYRALSVMAVQARTAKDMFEINQAIQAKINENNGAFPYKYITIDNATRLEELSLSYAAALYRNTAMGQGWGYKKDAKGINIKTPDNKLIIDPKADVRLLPNGAGY